MSITIEKLPAGEADGQKGSGLKEKIFLFFVLLLIGALCFEAGLLTKLWQTPEPIVVRVAPLGESALPAPSEKTPPALSEKPPAVAGAAAESAVPPSSARCLFVGSKNSTKYHSPGCSYAKRILPANLVCFASREDAEKKGYTAGCIQ